MAVGDAVPAEVQDAIEDALGDELPDGVTLPDLGDLSDLSDGELPPMPAMGSRNCSAVIEGDVSASWSEPQNAGTRLISYWFTDAERDFMGDDDEFTFIINCSGGDGSISLTTAGESGPDQIPQAPGTYELTQGAGFMGGGDSDVLSLMVNLNGFEGVLAVAEGGGTVTISEFDDDSLAMVIDAELYDSLAEMAGTDPVAATLHLEQTITRS